VANSRFVAICRHDHFGVVLVLDNWVSQAVADRSTLQVDVYGAGGQFLIVLPYLVRRGRDAAAKSRLRVIPINESAVEHGSARACGCGGVLVTRIRLPERVEVVLLVLRVGLEELLQEIVPANQGTPHML
jgi:hypothetical protein